MLGKQIKTHVHNLRPFIFSPNRFNPVEVAQQNEQEFMVIVEIIIEDPVWSSLFDGPAMTKVPTVGNHTRLDKLHEYLHEHKMRSLIPREHK